MKAKINKDRVELTELEVQNSGSINYYEIECEFDESWNGLSKEIVLAQSVDGIHRAIINNKAFIDKDKSGVYEIGFVGYTIENDVKTYQISTNLVPVNIKKGAGEIDVLDDVVPTPTEWETYIAQIQAMVDEIKDLPSYGITEEDIENWNNKVTDDDYVHTDNNFTDEEKEKLENIEEGAEVNKVDDVEVNGVSVVNNKKASIHVPIKTSELQNDSQFITPAYHDNSKQNVLGSGTGISIDDDTVSISDELKDTINGHTSDITGLEENKQDKQDDDLDTINKIVVNAINEIFASVGGIQGLIPSQASTINQLADKDFVNSSLNSITAFYITKNAQGDPFSTKAELTSATIFYSGGEVRVPTRNDYCVVLADESKQDPVTSENPTTRYIYQNSQWEYQYTVNKTALTANQLVAINSGITQALVTLIGTNQNNIATILADYIKSTNYATGSKAGIFKTGNGLGVDLNSGGIFAGTHTYQAYISDGNSTFIGKGTLENALAGKGLVKSTTIDENSTDDNVVTPKAVYDFIMSLDANNISY